MTEVTRCDSLTPVRNGQISVQCATLLAEQVKLTHGLSYDSGAESTESSLVKHYLVHMRFLISGFSLVWIRSESFHQNLRSTFTKPLLLVRFFLRLKEVKKNYTKTTKSCAILVISFDETCFRIPYLYWGSHP